MIYVTVPESYRQLGFSGLFHLEIDTPVGYREELKATAPRIIPGSIGWLLLEVTSEGRAVLVRKDSYAIADLMLKPRPRKEVPN
jgi:hypothetical protein